MHIDNRIVIPLKLFLIGLFVVLVVLQTLSVPGGAAYRAAQSPDLAYLRWPETAVGVFLILCAQVIVVSTWRLLGLVQDSRISSAAAFAWVDAIIWAIAAAWLLLASLFVFVIIPNADDPGGPFVLFLVVLLVAAVGLLMVVMRALLRQATMLRTDMEAVI